MIIGESTVIGAQVVSKRVTNAKSQAFVRTSLYGGKKTPGFWQVGSGTGSGRLT